MHEEGRIARKKRESEGRKNGTMRRYHRQREGWSSSSSRNLCDPYTVAVGGLPLQCLVMALKLRGSGTILRRTE